MELLGSSLEISRIVFILGAALAILFKKQVGIVPGGVVVPGLLAIELYGNWISVLAILGAAVLTFGIYELAIARFALSTRWTALTMMSLSVIIALVFYLGVVALAGGGEPIIASPAFIVPGLIALSARKYGAMPVLAGTSLVTAAAYLTGLLFYYLVPTRTMTQLSTSLAVYPTLALTFPMVLLFVSIATAMIVYALFGVRGGGYIVAPFLVSVAFHSPIQAAMLYSAMALTYVIVRAILGFTMIVGLQRFFTALLVSTIFVTVIDMIAASVTIPGYHVSPIILAVCIAVMVNDMLLKPLKISFVRGILPSQAVAYLGFALIG